jgi:hypothetical protein
MCWYTEIVQQLFIDFKKAFVSLRREVVYNIVLSTYETSQADWNVFLI